MQQFRNCCILGHEFPKAMIHDRDGVYGQWLPNVLMQFGCTSFKTSPKSPWENPYVERFNRSIKEEIFNRLVISDNDTVKAFCNSYQDYYNRKRPYQGIGGVTPLLPERTVDKKPDIDNLKVVKLMELNGLATHFKIAA